MKEITVLLVDDLLFMRTALASIVRKAGMIVVGEAANGLEAVKMYGDSRPSVVLMDITMPVMDGIEALERIITIDPSANVIMCSALGQSKYIIRSIQQGAKDFIIKPFNSTRIISSISKVIGLDD